ncbi:hypothetical protein ACSBR1_035740 [Camellia fascicularis]
MKKNSKLAGVNVHYYKDESAPTGTCAVCVVGGERSVSHKLARNPFCCPTIVLV